MTFFKRKLVKSTVYKYVYKTNKPLDGDNNFWVARINTSTPRLYLYKGFETEEQAGRAIDFFMVMNNKKPVNGFKIVKKQ